MKCLFNFKCKSKQKRGAKSAPEISRKNKSDSPGLSSNFLPSPKTIPEMYKEKNNLRVFSLKELKDATNGFSSTLKIGEGGFGYVYQETIRDANGKGDPTLVAIKMLNQHSLQGHKEWLAKVQFLCVVSHPNLVKLLGYCLDDGKRGIQRLLVYEFMPNRSLDDHLFCRTLPVMPWKTRLQIILGAAEGLAYLHNGLEVQVIHRDFKSSNVLLDADFIPKLSDFGLAREDLAVDICVSIADGNGYVALEYVETGHLRIHSDVWSFGVVLYEILTGRRAFDRNRSAEEQNLIEWVKQFSVDSNRFNVIMDPRLRDQYSLASTRMVAKLADKCLNMKTAERPTMPEVVEILNQALQETETGVSTHLQEFEKRE